jgi:hypothetical protein
MDLPDDVMSYIFTFIPLKQLFEIEWVCERWKSLLNRKQIWFNNSGLTNDILDVKREAKRRIAIESAINDDQYTIIKPKFRKLLLDKTIKCITTSCVHPTTDTTFMFEGPGKSVIHVPCGKKTLVATKPYIKGRLLRDSPIEVLTTGDKGEIIMNRVSDYENSETICFIEI